MRITQEVINDLGYGKHRYVRMYPEGLNFYKDYFSVLDLFKLKHQIRTSDFDEIDASMIECLSEILSLQPGQALTFNVARDIPELGTAAVWRKEDTY